MSNSTHGIIRLFTPPILFDVAADIASRLVLPFRRRRVKTNLSALSPLYQRMLMGTYSRIRASSPLLTELLVDGDIKKYAEFGSGASTLWVMEEMSTDVQIFSVESSPRWAAEMDTLLTRNGRRGTVSHVDLGPVSGWGYPEGYPQRDKILNYVEFPFKIGTSFDLIYIDGVFRVASFLTSLIFAEPGTKIVFDDYNNRKKYQVVEEILYPASKKGKQALFIRPEKIDGLKVKALRDDFLVFMD